jgi:linoleoyl-CoA desaturase
MKDRHINNPQDAALLELIHKEVRENLNKKSKTGFLWLKFLFYLSLSGAAYCLMLFAQDPYIFILSYILYGFLILLFAFNFAHDLSHNTVFKNKKWNNLSFIIIYALNGAHAEAWRHRHIHSHHFAPNVEDYDSDLRISKLIRVIPGSKQYWFHRYQHLYAPFLYTFYSLYWILIKDLVLLFHDPELIVKKNYKYYFSFCAQKLFYVVYLLEIPLMFSEHSWYLVLLGFICMHLFQSVFLLFTFFMTHHVESTHYPTTDKNGFINSSWLMNQIKSSNDMYPFSKTANFIFGGFNNHVAHHLFPNLHHVHYPELNRILYRVLKENDIYPNQTTYFGGIMSHLRLLKKMGRKQNESEANCSRPLSTADFL